MRPFYALSRITPLAGSTNRQWLLGAVPIGVAAMIFSLAVAFYLFNGHLAQQKEQLLLIAAKTAATFNHEIAQRAYSVTAMRETAEQYLSGRSLLTLDPTRYLHLYKNNNGYTLDLPPDYTENSIGNITGAGPVPARNSLAAQEMSMTIGLMPLFQAVVTRDSDTPWVYYTSQNRFTHIYPRASPAEFFYTDKSLEYDVYTMALPAKNPQHKVFWTPPYLDEAGKGMMVTVAAPVYQGSHFRGTIAIDITLSKLALLLKSFETPQFHVYLYAENGDYLAGPSNILSFRPVDIPPDTVIGQDNYFVTDVKLNSVPWRILVVTSRYGIYNSAFWYALPFVLVVAFLFGSVLLLIALIGSLREAQECSIRDGLTGLYNRRHFDVSASRALASAQRDGNFFGLIMLDIDYFKRYNDTFGHQAGDDVLKKVSLILSASLKRPTDTIFRIGGEEFAILTKAERPEQIETLAQILLSAVADAPSNFLTHPHGKVTVSIGVTILSPATSLSLDNLYSQTDQALYRAKEEGRNRAISIRL